MHEWWVFVHVVGAFAFVLAHGVSSGVGMRLRRERDPQRIRALLDLSEASRGLTYWSSLVLLVGGIVSGFLGNWWGQGWIWAALGLFVALMAAAVALAVPYYRRVRESVGLQSARQRRRGIPPGPPAEPEEVEALLSSPRGLVIAAVGTIALLVLVWLMVLKPF